MKRKVYRFNEIFESVTVRKGKYYFEIVDSQNLKNFDQYSQ